MMIRLLDSGLSQNCVSKLLAEISRRLHMTIVDQMRLSNMNVAVAIYFVWDDFQALYSEHMIVEQHVCALAPKMSLFSAPCHSLGARGIA